jgi:hypothetical protein
MIYTSMHSLKSIEDKLHELSILPKTQVAAKQLLGLGFVVLETVRDVYSEVEMVLDMIDEEMTYGEIHFRMKQIGDDFSKLYNYKRIHEAILRQIVDYEEYLEMVSDLIFDYGKETREANFQYRNIMEKVESLSPLLEDKEADHKIDEYLAEKALLENT